MVPAAGSSGFFNWAQAFCWIKTLLVSTNILMLVEKMFLPPVWQPQFVLNYPSDSLFFWGRLIPKIFFASNIDFVGSFFLNKIRWRRRRVIVLVGKTSRDRRRSSIKVKKEQLSKLDNEASWAFPVSSENR